MPVFLKIPDIDGESSLSEEVAGQLQDTSFNLDPALVSLLGELSEYSGSLTDYEFKFLDFEDGKRFLETKDKFLGATLEFDAEALPAIQEALGFEYENVKIKYIENGDSFFLKIDDIAGESVTGGAGGAGKSPFLKIGDIDGESIYGALETYGIKLGDQTEDLINDVYLATMDLKLGDVEFVFLNQDAHKLFPKVELVREDMAMFVKFDGLEAAAHEELIFKLGSLEREYGVDLSLKGGNGDYFLKIPDIAGESFEPEPEVPEVTSADIFDLG